ncbi:bifunctional heparan sulfate N-deacetylase/N-sulfotransferase-like [Stegodyphus dumicola]|uniref:bifunctional heparan sulfate N-deacetylase/N-sulfotransferase-like n=1 Tax=Stegodyphus dumicola TaxID=202533 RepID=UPI0015B14B2D|nr:bifunctional heparan sulfate N-deacetylase/N-sulfotransferase-like [Stegodyphus dumicola]
MVLEVKGLFSILVQKCCFSPRPAIHRCWLSACVLSLISLVICAYYIAHVPFNSTMKVPKELTFRCKSSFDRSADSSKIGYPAANVHASSARLRLDAKVLVFVETQYSHLGRQISEILEASRIKFKMEIAGKSLPLLTNLDKGKFAVLVFENFEKYLHMNKWNRELLDKYCREYNVGIIGFIKAQEETYVGAQLKGFPLYVHTNMALRDYHLNGDSTVLRLTRAGEVFYGNIPGSDWTVFQPNHSTYEALASARSQTFQPYLAAKGIDPLLTTVVHDHGSYDGISRVLFGNGFQFWIHRLLFLDAISFLSHGKLSLPLQRFLLIDIDDIFVGEKSTRMKPSDVIALLNAQNRIKRTIPGFRFNLGFSGKFYHKGTDEENLGDDMLTEHAEEFWWFCHMWSHSQPHLFENITALEMEMKLNREFAKVLPRQTCGLYTHTIFLDKYPGGPEKLELSIKGGELFYLFVYNPVNVFMTHLSNYGNDRLALYTFESVIKFVQCWTNLQLITLPPLQLADKYFQTYPEESDPVWMNPCNDKRHRAIWSSAKSCEQLPKFLVIGPQKTGTTALYTFLSMHPAIVSNYPSPETFEEVQFFNGRNYYKGLDWYMNFFPVPKNSTDKYLFEKSATYFDGDLVPMRAHAMLTAAKLITILRSPIKRAYSWYQHMRAHKDPTALNYSFQEIVSTGDRGHRALRELRNRCLMPGMYAQHLDRWLSFYSPQQLLIIDGEELKSDPVAVMSKLQQFLKIKPFLNYKDHLRYDPKKGFFCQVSQERNNTKCLGRSKGRLYPPVDPQTEKFLKAFYLPHNIALSKLLTKLRQPIPLWLEKDLSHGS